MKGEQSAESVRRLTYPFRRFITWVKTPETVCRKPLCARPIVGFSVWCRKHTDDVLAGRKP